MQNSSIVNTALTYQVVDKFAGLLDRGKRVDDSHLRLLETDRIPDMKDSIADGESVQFERHGTSLDVQKGLYDRPSSNQVAH